MRFTLARVEAAWLALCIAGWLLLSLAGAQSEAECRAEGGFLCFTTAEVFYIVGLFALGAVVIGALAIALAWALVRWFRRA